MDQLPRRTDLLEELDHDLVALDDIQPWLGSTALEAAIMALYQQQLATGRAVLMAAAHPATQLEFALPDLASRLRALPGYRVLAPDDAGLRWVLERTAARQGLELSPEVQDFWLHRAPRDLPALLMQLQQLDARALAEQRRLTIPFLKQVLSL